MINPTQCLILLEMAKTGKVIVAKIEFHREFTYQLVSLGTNGYPDFNSITEVMNISRKDVKYLFKQGLFTRRMINEYRCVYEIYWPKVMDLKYTAFKEIQAQHSVGTL